MITNDLTHFPLVITVFDSAPTIEQQKVFFTQWTSWFKKKQKFVTLRIYKNENALQRPDGSGQETKQWMENNRENIQQSVVAMANVLPETTENQRGSKSRLGIPNDNFTQIEEAMDWLFDHLALADINIDRQSVLNTIAKL
ncbi:hypothetical protein ABTD63_04420 [Acinetobacter baumannii]